MLINQTAIVHTVFFFQRRIPSQPYTSSIVCCQIWPPTGVPFNPSHLVSSPSDVFGGVCGRRGRPGGGHLLHHRETARQDQTVQRARLSRRVSVGRDGCARVEGDIARVVPLIWITSFGRFCSEEEQVCYGGLGFT